MIDELIDELLRKHPPATTPPAEFWGAQYDLGLAWVHFPVGYGGLALDPKLQEDVDARLEEAGAPSNVNVNFMGIGMAGPTIVARGTEEQKQRFLRKAFTCEEIWCQFFSEPGAGSDLASLATRAVRDGDEWVINGQKVWTTLAHIADWAMILARTDPEQPKHRGLTYFLIDVRQPGIEVRPLRQINGEAEFNEVFFTDARTPDALRVGDVGDGWAVALTTLMNERVAFGHLSRAPRGSGAIGEAMGLFRERWRDDDAARDELVRAWIDNELVRLTTIRAQEMRDQGTPGPEGSVVKLAYTTILHDTWALALEFLGPDGLLIDNYDMVQPTLMGGSAMNDENPDVARAFLTSKGGTIGGGTADIGKNILAERVLGLPGDPRVDKDLPWSQVPRS
ncbi:MAG TPA: acyl-CoA dehydrogenase family protein [Acidimicrobiales bacterium]|nr:acyl-CoA dehydrogenase family protein [Acidimicrobiales bacterium]